MGIRSRRFKIRIVQGHVEYRVFTMVASTSFVYYTNLSINTSTAYYYKVCAYRLVGSTKVYSSFSAVVSARTALRALDSVKVAPMACNIKVTWGSGAGASKYE